MKRERVAVNKQWMAKDRVLRKTKQTASSGALSARSGVSSVGGRSPGMSMVEREKARLQKIKEKQEREMQQQVEHEMRVSWGGLCGPPFPRGARSMFTTPPVPCARQLAEQAKAAADKIKQQEQKAKEAAKEKERKRKAAIEAKRKAELAKAAAAEEEAERQREEAIKAYKEEQARIAAVRCCCCVAEVV